MQNSHPVYGAVEDLSRFVWSIEEIALFKKKMNTILTYMDKDVSLNSLVQLVDHWDYLVGRIPFCNIWIDCNYVLRFVQNDKVGELFKDEWRVSYNLRRKDLIDLNRFNYSEETMFYALVLSGKDDSAITRPVNVSLKDYEDASMVTAAALEVCKEMIDPDNLYKKSYVFTVGKWFTDENNPLIVQNLCFNEVVLNKNSKIREQVSRHIRSIKSNMEFHSKNFLLVYWYWLSELAANKMRNKQQYLITTALSHAIRKQYNGYYNGIAYPGSMSINEEINLVLQPSAVDSYLKLKEVFMCRFYPEVVNGILGYVSEECSDLAKVVDQSFELQNVTHWPQ